MATFEKVHLSGSTGGREIIPSATASPGSTIHTTGTSATIIDEVTLIISNTQSTAQTVRLQWGMDSVNPIVFSLDPYEVRQFTHILSGDGTTGRVIKVWAGSAAVCAVHGWVNRITP